MIDLHVHTTASDGQYSPSQIVQMATEKGIKILAITDHDTVDGIPEAQAKAEKNGVHLIPGIEISINWPRGEFHLLGLGLKSTSKSLEELIQKVLNHREERNLEIINKMNADGIPINYETLQKKFPGRPIGRPHIASELVELGIVKKRQQAFDRFLASGRPYYVPRIGSNLDEAIVAIDESGGVPVIAHPMSLYLSWGKLPEMLEKIHGQGVLGLEAFHPGARMTDCLRLEEVGRKLGFFITAASDFHGEKIRADRRLGHTAGGKPIDDKFWYDELKKYL